MAKSITPNQIKQNNRNIIYKYIYDSKEKAVSQQDISYALRLSRPTVTANLNSLEKTGLIQKDGLLNSEFVGRKATAYSISPDFRLAVGVEILRREIKLAAVDLYGKIISRKKVSLPYNNDESYYSDVSSEIREFIKDIGAKDEQILGVGFAIQGLVSADKQTVLYGKILSCTGLSAGKFASYLPYPCELAHDADSAAIAELWVSHEIKDAVYLSLSRHVGAAIIADGQLKLGKHGHNATIEHIQLQPYGKKCYCGKRGCMETLCSVEALLDGRSLEATEDFFYMVRKKSPEESIRWKKYLSDLAQSINLIHLVQDTDFILGGYLAGYINDEDISFLYDCIDDMTPFEEDRDFLHISKMPKHNIAIGAALPFIKRFLSEDLPDTEEESLKEKAVQSMTAPLHP